MATTVKIPANALTDEQAIEQRQKYVTAWNAMMVRIWQEQITLLDVIDTKALLNSPTALAIHADGRFFEFSVSQEFLEYGLYQDYGTGRETPKGNSGDIGRAKTRQRRRWFSRKYFASVMSLSEFMQENVGQQFIGILSNALNRRHEVKLSK